MIVEAEVVARDEIDASRALDLPGCSSHRARRLEERCLVALACPVALECPLEFPPLSDARIPEN